MTREEREILNKAMIIISGIISGAIGEKVDYGGSTYHAFIKMLTDKGIKENVKFTTTELINLCGITEENIVPFLGVINYSSGPIHIKLGKILSKIAAVQVNNSDLQLKKHSIGGISVYLVVKSEF